MTKKEIKKAKIKSIILKIINVLCYIGTAFLILILIIVGVQSCKQKQVNNNVNNVPSQQLVIRKKALESYSNSIFDNYDEYNYYEFSFEDGSRIPLADQSELCDFSIDLSENVSSSAPGIFAYIFNNTNDLPVYVFDDVYGKMQLEALYLYFTPYQANLNLNLYYYRIQELNGFFTDIDGVNHFVTILQKTTNIAYNYEYHVLGGSLEIVADKGTDFYVGAVTYFYQLHEPVSFIFNKVFNYNAPFKSTIDSVYGNTSSFSHVSDYGAYIDYDVGYFISNDMLFNKIRVHYYNSAWIRVSNDIVQMPSGNYTYAMMEYINNDTSSAFAVNVRDSVPYNLNGGSTTYFANSSTWYNDAFRQIIFLEDLSQDLLVKINAFNNNNQNSISGFVGAGDVTDVFTLVGSAFTAWLPVMNIYILPGITLGILIFIPLVATLVFAIIRIIKK